jgi:3-methyladenine DNA glycosylase AlkD
MKARSPSSSTPTRRSKESVRSAGILPANKAQTKTEASELWTLERALADLQRHGSKHYMDGMAHFVIHTQKAFGVSTPDIQKIARKIRKNHQLGLQLWDTGVHDARTLAVFICDPERVTADLMERWAKDFDNWAACDGACCHLFATAKPAWQKSLLWTRRKNEFEKRAGFALIAYLAIHDKAAEDARFARCLEAIERESWDDRHFVRKAVNGALRNIGKRNKRLHRQAIACAERIKAQGTRAARWIAADALRELKSQAVQLRLSRKP